MGKGWDHRCNYHREHWYAPRAAEFPANALYYRNFQSGGESPHLICSCAKKELVDASLMASESVVGSLDNGNTGIFTAWPVEMVKGLEKRAN